MSRKTVGVIVGGWGTPLSVCSVLVAVTSLRGNTALAAASAAEAGADVVNGEIA